MKDLTFAKDGGRVDPKRINVSFRVVKDDLHWGVQQWSWEAGDGSVLRKAEYLDERCTKRHGGSCDKELLDAEEVLKEYEEAGKEFDDALKKYDELSKESTLSDFSDDPSDYWGTDSDDYAGCL